LEANSVDLVVGLPTSVRSEQNRVRAWGEGTKAWRSRLPVTGYLFGFLGGKDDRAVWGIGKGVAGIHTRRFVPETWGGRNQKNGRRQQGETGNKHSGKARVPKKNGWAGEDPKGPSVRE